MHAYSLSHVGDRELLRGLTSLVTQERATTATLLAHLAEVDARRLYLPAAHPSMFSYCVHELRLSEDAAYKRIQAARVARQFPAIFELLADGRLHLTAVLLCSSYLTAENAEPLLALAAGKTRAELERLLAERFPRPGMLTRVEADLAAVSPLSFRAQLAPERVGQPGPGPAAAPAPRVAPLSHQRYVLQFTIEQETYDDLRHAQALLGHRVPSGDVAQVMGRALKALIGQLEKTKFAATDRPRRSPPRTTTSPRHIPAHVRRAVWARDGARCTFVSEAGRRCPARTRLEFDHVQEVARGGRACVAGIRLRCRAHNQYGAECAFGAEFMRRKREQARRGAEVRRQETGARAAGEARRKAAEARARAAAVEVIAPLRLLGFRADEAHRAAALCEALPEASLEQRLRLALSYFRPRPGSIASSAPGPASTP